jgi:signal transduction histidine kinase
MIPRNPMQWPIRWQIAALLIVTQIVAHLVTITMIDLSTARNGGGRIELAMGVSEPMLTALRMIDGADSRETMERLADLVAKDTRFRLQAGPPAGSTGSDTPLDATFDAALVDALPTFWQHRVNVYNTEAGAISSAFPLSAFAIAAELPTGAWLIFEPRRDSFLQNFPRTIVLLGLFILGSTLMFLSVWAGSSLVAPISRLAHGAERFAGDADATDLPERGPVEVRRATRAFNRMRQRIRKLINDRSQTLASIGHDMRTPLTRMRLRLELLDDSPAKVAIENDALVLERMIDDALGFLRSENRPLSRDLVDIAVLAKTVVDETADQGHRITYHGPQRVVVRCDHDLVRRVLENVIGNAAKFAGDAVVVVSDRKSDAVLIEVQDRGPGIPLEQRDKVLEPFARVEAVRSGSAQTPEGFGLGLAIARDLMERHGGTLDLSDNQPRGLTVTLTLPRGFAPEQHGPTTA